MSLTHNITWSWQSGTTSFEHTEAVSAGLERNLDESIPDSSTDLAVTFALDQSAMKSFYLVSDQVVTIKTNNSSTPDDTLVLVASTPVVWTANCQMTNPITVDVAQLYVTNASGTAATLKIRALEDPTP